MIFLVVFFSDFQEPYAVVVLLDKDLVVIDLGQKIEGRDGIVRGRAFLI